MTPTSRVGWVAVSLTARRELWRLCLAGSTLALVAAVAQGQPRGADTNDAGATNRVAEIKGQLAGIEGGLLQVLDEAEQPYLVQIDPERSTVVVRGEAEVEFVRPGMFVRFKSTLDSKGNATEEVAELTLFTPRESTPLGVTSENPQEPGGVYEVLAQVQSIKKNKWSVAAGDVAITFKLAAEATIEVKVSDPTWASAGDEIEVKGRAVGEGQIAADVVEIRLREPLSPPKKKRGRGRARKETEKP